MKTKRPASIDNNTNSVADSVSLAQSELLGGSKRLGLNFQNVVGGLDFQGEIGLDFQDEGRGWVNGQEENHPTQAMDYATSSSSFGHLKENHPTQALDDAVSSSSSFQSNR